MSAKWEEAAARYRSHQRTPPDHRAIRELKKFLGSNEGRTALELLRASQQDIVFAETNLARGPTSTYLLTGEGPKRYDDSSARTGIDAERHRLKGESITVEMLVGAAINPHMTRVTNKRILTWLRAELDKIAERAPGRSS